MKRRPLKLFAFDTEDDGKGKPFLWNFYDVHKDIHHTFKKQDDALDFVCSQRYAQYWACNLEYDINNLFRGIFGILRYSYAGSRLLSAELGAAEKSKDKPDRIFFYDTLNHWHFSVKEMGKRINLPKLEMEHTGSSKVTNRMIEYCRRDTEIVGKFVASMQKIYDAMGCELKMTVASTTLDFFETKYYKRIHHNFKETQIDFFHKGYYGGRTEIFYTRPISGAIWYHDVNSLYPYCLKNFQFPVLDDFQETKQPNYALEGMVDCTISAPDKLGIPYLPHKKDGKLIFPVGSWRGVYTYFEIRESLLLGYKVKKVYRAIEFSSTFNPFTNFIGEIYQQRLTAKSKGDELIQIVYKNLMNYAYGKFAQGNEFTKLIPISQHKKWEPGDEILFDLVLTKKKDKYPRYAGCIWACYVTAYARHTLYQGLSKIFASGATLLYCDTDSIIYENKKSLIKDSKELGEFKLELCGECNEPYTSAHFKLPKLYSLTCRCQTRYKAKGVPFVARKDYFENSHAEFKRPRKLRETLRGNVQLASRRAKGTTKSKARNTEIVPNYWELREKRVNAKYDKRIEIGRTGKTRPISLCK